jgi:signal transduction histidine kinase
MSTPRPSLVNNVASEKRRKLTARITLFSTVFALVHFVLDLSQGLVKSASFDSVIAITIFSFFILNRAGLHTPAKVGLLLLLNFFLAAYASLVPPDVGVYFFFFPLIAVSAALFGPLEKKFRYGLILLPFLILVFLFVTDFRFLEAFAFEQPEDRAIFFWINIFSSGIVLVLCIHFMISLNEGTEHTLQKLAEEINAKNNDLERTNAELDRFLYSTSHDLQSPLSSIKGLINVARYDTQDPKMLTYLGKMTERVNRLETFIKDIINYSKNTRTEVLAEKVEFHELVNEVRENLLYVDGAKDIHFRYHQDFEQPVLLDKSRVLVILHNLLANAIKYHDHHKTERWIKVDVSSADSRIKLIVADNGLGIDTEHQGKIFDMFYRGTVKSAGSGLGLFIVKQALEKLNGNIMVQSSPGQGTTFQVLFPISG